ncbi:MAG: porin family protein [Robiginitalea sp.]|jgi:hypothetical protein
MKYGILFISLLFSLTLRAQADVVPDQDQRYREDQFYLGVTYNLLLDLPQRVSQNGLSYGLQSGFIRDFPLNQACTFAIGVGLGYSFNSYYTNLRAIEDGSDIRYEILDGTVDYKRNKLETHIIELPVEIRWRNSTRTDYKFWRIYGGFKLGYIVGTRSKFVTKDFVDSFYNSDSENFRYGLMLNVGYNTFNLHLYYGLNSLFEDGVTISDGQSLEMAPLHLGLIFYIL